MKLIYERFTLENFVIDFKKIKYWVITLYMEIIIIMQVSSGNS